MTAAKTTFADRYGPWALVAGASEGMGHQYALQLAERGLNVVMVAREPQRLAAAADEVRTRGTEVRTVSADLAAEDIVEQLSTAIADLEIGLLVYNAGISTQHDFFQADIDEHLAQLNVNCRGPVLLSHALGRRMVERGRGGIILMSSVAGFVGSGLNAMYAATKSFDIVLAEGLSRDLERYGVDVLAMVAGATRTPNFERSQTGKANVSVMAPVDVVREALDALGKRELHIAGSNKYAALLLSRLLPRRVASRVLTRASYALAGANKR